MSSLSWLIVSILTLLVTKGENSIFTIPLQKYFSSKLLMNKTTTTTTSQLELFKSDMASNLETGLAPVLFVFVLCS